MSVENLYKDCTSVVGAVVMEPSDVSVAIKDAFSPSESSKQPMAFMIHFADNKDVALPKLQENFSKYAVRHKRIPSLPNVDDSQKAKREANTVQAVGLSPLPMRGARRGGYHSEGYFSSDQDEDLRGRGDFFVKKFKNLEKGLRMTNLAQEKIMADMNRELNSAHTDSYEFGDFSEADNLQKMAYDETGVESKRHNTSLNNLSVLKPEVMQTREDWLVSGASDEEIEAQNMMDELNDLDLDVKNDSSNETVSEAGTYTIDKDAPCPDVEHARLEIQIAVEKKLDTENGTHSVRDSQQENNFTIRSLYRDGTNWVNEWATQVAKHNHNSSPEKPRSVGLPPLPLGKHQSAGHASQVVQPRIPSPVLSPEVPYPTGHRLHSSPQHVATRNLQSPLMSLPVQETGDGQSDSSLETESFLRATESVVTAMQARMSFSLDSGGESDVDTSHSYQAPSYSTAGGGGGDKHLTFRRPSATAQSDSSSDTGGGGGGTVKSKHKDMPTAAVPASAPQMRYNRAFSLRRARLETEEPSPAAGDIRRKKSDAAPPTVTNPANKTKKNVELPKSVQARSTAKGKGPKVEAFSRTDCGRFSVRAPKNSSQPLHTPKPATAMKKDVNRKQGGASGRSNSTLSSREVEFQNWKRRKSYDPMKAAAEGKKKEAAKKATMSSSMTQSSIAPSELSPSSTQNPVLRSASFHGTAGLTPKYISSEDEEETLSADEASPISGQPPCLAAPLSPSKMPLECAFGGSRASLYSNASNSSLRGRNKLEALDSLVMAAMCSLSNKLRASSCNLLKKLRYLYEEDSERAGKLSAVIEVLENSATPSSPQTKSPSKELSGTLKNLKRMENVFKVLDEVLFDEEDFDLELEDYQ